MRDDINAAVPGIASHARIIAHASQKLRDEVLKLLGAQVILEPLDNEIFDAFFSLNRNLGGAHSVNVGGLKRFAIQRGKKFFRIVADLKESDCRSNLIKRRLRELRARRMYFPPDATAMRVFAVQGWEKGVIPFDKTDVDESIRL
ncbi:MAG: hypothetical protein M3178_18245 [Pseudomonadota bacterium]|nr:hypothetical protein [Pseudomonadota bacterium]